MQGRWVMSYSAEWNGKVRYDGGKEKKRERMDEMTDDASGNQSLAEEGGIQLYKKI